jgi:hypothetical protein
VRCSVEVLAGAAMGMIPPAACHECRLQSSFQGIKLAVLMSQDIWS